MFCCCFKYLVCVIVLSLLYLKFRNGRCRSPPIFNIYQTPTCFYWLKVGFMFSVISFRKWIRQKKGSCPTPEELDRPQALSYHEKAIDAVYFNAANKQGDYFVTGTARRQQKLVDAFLILKVADSGLGVLVNPKVPDTALYQTEESDEYCVDGIAITPEIPMKKWNLTYAGKMKSMERKELYDVQIDLHWTSDLPYFNFDTDMDPLSTAKYIALEPWSAQFFKTLEDAHQTHYEQFGKACGTVSINGKKYPLNMNSCRDHSFGKKRHWSIFHRYVLHYISTENGDHYSVLNICAPIIGSDMLLGYVYCSETRKCYPLQSCDLLLYQHGEGGTPPDDYAFSFTANNKQYTMQVNILHSAVFYASKDWEGRVMERLCTATVNGTSGWGITEWEYRNVAGRMLAK